MIKYVRVNNSVFAYFDKGYSYTYWVDDLLRYFTKHSPDISSCKVADIVRGILSECAESGMKFYGMTNVIQMTNTHRH